MEIVKEQSAMLSNSEMYLFLKEVRENLKATKHKERHYRGRDSEDVHDQKNLETIAYETIQYLEQNTPSVDIDVIPGFLKAIEPFHLTKAEKLQLLNHRPTTLVEIQLLIEESEERLSEEQMEEILQTVGQFLNPSKSDD